MGRLGIQLKWLMSKSLAQSAGGVEYTASLQGWVRFLPATSILDDTKQSSDAGALGNAKHPFMAIALRSTLARSGNT